MEYLIILIISIVILVILAFIVEFSIKKVKDIAENEELNEITNGFPENIDIAKSILKKLNNENVVIEENNESKTSLYIVVTNKISIANIRDNFTRIQTIAHECLHSVQNKKLLWTNFIFSNIYIIYTLLLLILTIFRVLKPSLLQAIVLLLFIIVHYFIRSMLEMDAMTKARYVAKEYLEENNICSKEICSKIVGEYDRLNNVGIKIVNYNILFTNFIKLMVYCIICAIYSFI